MASRTISRLVVLIALTSLCACASTQKTINARDNFNQGEAAFASKKYEQAIEQYKKVKESYASPELTSQAELKIADAYFENKSYIEAASAYEEFRKLHPTNPKAPYALYRLALSHYNEITGIDTDQTPVKNAVAAFESFLAAYPASEYAPEAQEKLADCRKKELAYEVYVGNFYVRTDRYQSAIKRLTEAREKFPGMKQDELLLRLGQAYLGAGDKEKGKATLERMVQEYPLSPFVKEARKALPK